MWSCKEDHCGWRFAALVGSQTIVGRGDAEDEHSSDPSSNESPSLLQVHSALNRKGSEKGGSFAQAAAVKLPPPGNGKRMRFDELVEAQENHGISKTIVDYTIQNEHLTNSMRGNFFAKSLCRPLKAATYQERRVWLETREWDDYANDKEANFL